MNEFFGDFAFLAMLSIFFIFWEVWKLVRCSEFTKMKIALMRRATPIEKSLQAFPILIIELAYWFWACCCIFEAFVSMYFRPLEGVFLPLLFIFTSCGLYALSLINPIIKKHCRLRTWVNFQPIDSVVSLFLLSAPFIAYLFFEHFVA